MLRVGVIGLGVGQGHAKGFDAIDGVRVTAIADSNQERLETFRGGDDLKRYARYEALCDDPDLDVVSVCLPNFLHEPAAVRAFGAGKHVMCEKPMAHNLESGMRIAEAARRSGKSFMMNLHQRFTPGATHIRSLVDSGEFGDVYYSFSSYLRQPGGIPSGVGGWFYKKAQSGGGALLDNGVHLLDQQWYLMGCPRPVEAMGQTYSQFGPKLVADGFDVDDFATGVVRFENGATLVFDNAWAALVREATHFVRVLGTKMGGTAQPFCVVKREGGGCTDVTPSHVQTETPFQHFARSIVQGQTPIVTPDQALTMLRILDALYRSAVAGTSVAISPE